MINKVLQQWTVFAEPIDRYTPVNIPFITSHNYVVLEEADEEHTPMYIYDTRTQITTPSFQMTPGHFYLFEGVWHSDPAILGLERCGETSRIGRDSWINIASDRNETEYDGNRLVVIESFISQCYRTVLGSPILSSADDPGDAAVDMVSEIKAWYSASTAGYTTRSAFFTGTVKELDASSLISLTHFVINDFAYKADWLFNGVRVQCPVTAPDSDNSEFDERPSRTLQDFPLKAVYRLKVQSESLDPKYTWHDAPVEASVYNPASQRPLNEPMRPVVQDPNVVASTPTLRRPYIGIQYSGTPVWDIPNLPAL